MVASVNQAFWTSSTLLWLTTRPSRMVRVPWTVALPLLRAHALLARRQGARVRAFRGARVPRLRDGRVLIRDLPPGLRTSRGRRRKIALTVQLPRATMRLLEAARLRALHDADAPVK